MVLVNSVNCVKVKLGQTLAGAGFVAAGNTILSGLIGDPYLSMPTDEPRPTLESERRKRSRREIAGRVNSSGLAATRPTRSRVGRVWSERVSRARLSRLSHRRSDRRIASIHTARIGQRHGQLATVANWLASESLSRRASEKRKG